MAYMHMHMYMYMCMYMLWMFEQPMLWMFEQPMTCVELWLSASTPGCEAL